MDEFNYLSVLVSIILGLGITRLLTGLGQQIEYRGRGRTYWPSLLWAVVLLVIHVQTWWSMFGMRSHEGWTFLAFLVVLLQPVTLYLLAALVLPTTAPGEPVDLRAHYYWQTRWFFGLFVALLAVSLVKDLVLAGVLPAPANVAFHLVFMAMAAAAAVTERARYHEAVAALTPVLFGAYVVLLFSQLA